MRPSSVSSPVQSPTMNANAWPLSRFWSQLTPAAQQQLGGSLAKLSPDGHEIAELFLRRLQRPGGAVDLAALDAETAESLPGLREAADKAIRHEVSLLDGYEPQLLGTPIDWFRAPRGDFQWPTHLSRHYWLTPAAKVWRATRDPIYSAVVIETLLDWIARTPLDSPNLKWGEPNDLKDDLSPLGEGLFKDYVDGPWTSLSCHIRTDVWSLQMAILADAPQMTNETAARLLNSLNDDQRRSMIAFPRSMNQGQGIAYSLIHLAWWYPFFRSAEATAKIGWERMERFATRDIYPDGGMAECSPNYGMFCLKRVIETAKSARLHGTTAPAIMLERARTTTRCYALIADPMGCSPRIAKGGEKVLAELARLNETFDDPEVRFITTRGKEGVEPKALSACFPWVGHVVFRSSWSPDATWMFFEPGPRGSGHHDIATLNVQLIANGQWLLTDPGYYTYSNSGEEGAMAAYLKSSAAHNLALVDGKVQRSRVEHRLATPNVAPTDYAYSDDGQCARASGVFRSGFGPNGETSVVHRRTVKYLRGQDRFVIEDSFEGEGEHTIALHWQTAPEALVTTETGGFQVRQPGARLDARVMSGDQPLSASLVKGQTSPLLGWFSKHYGDLTPTVTCVCETKGVLPLVIRTELQITR